MIERVLLVAWKGSAATSWVEQLKEGGFTVLLEDTTGERAWRTAKERGIDCVIIDGQKKPSHGRQTGHALRDTAKTRNIPIIWTNLDIEDAASVAAEVKPDVTLTAPTSAPEALAALNSLSPGVTPALPGLRSTEPAHEHPHHHEAHHHDEAPHHHETHAREIPAHQPLAEEPVVAPAPVIVEAPTPAKRAAPARRPTTRTKAKATAKTAAKQAKKPAPKKAAPKKARR
jgi:DNA-binding response OmpR family regulator